MSNKLIVFGDSHIEMYRPFVTDLCAVAGATAYGLINENSVTNAKGQFTSFITSTSSNYIISCLGEVDCNSLVWKKRETMSWKDLVKESIDRYINFLSQFSCKFIVSCVPLPPVELYNVPPFSTKPAQPFRIQVDWDKRLRTDIVNYFNLSMFNLCKQNDIFFLDFTEETKNNSGLLNMDFAINSNNTHLDPIKMKSIIYKKLKELF